MENYQIGLFRTIHLKDVQQGSLCYTIMKHDMTIMLECNKVDNTMRLSKRKNVDNFGETNEDEINKGMIKVKR